MNFSRYLALDTETTADVRKNAVKPWHPTTRLTHLSWWTVSEEGDKKGGVTNKIETIHKVCESDKIKVFWNAKFDLHILHLAGIKVRGPYLDVLILARLLDTAALKFDLKSWARRHLDVNYIEEIRLKEYCKKERCCYGDAPARLLKPYALRDAQSTFELWIKLWKSANGAVRKLFRTEMQVLRCVLEMERLGVQLNIPRAQELIEKARPKLAKLLVEIRDEVGHEDFNPRSTPQLQQILYDGFVDVQRWTKTGNPSTDEIALLTHPYDIARKILRYRKLEKFLNTYLKGLIDGCKRDGCLHPSFNQGGTRTGRFSSSNPNLQNLPRVSKKALGQIRSLIQARHGQVFLFLDYEQVELRVGAHLANEIKMLKALCSGEDIHALTAQTIFHGAKKDKDWWKKRFIGKGLNFAVFYGVGPEGFRAKLLKDSEGRIRITFEQADRYIRRFHDLYPAIQPFYEQVTQEVAETGGITNPFGRFIHVPSETPYVGVNYKVQSTPADLLKVRIPHCVRACSDLSSRLLLVVHDELIFEVPERHVSVAARTLKDIMEEHRMFNVPLTVSAAVGKTWGSKTTLDSP